MPVLKSISDVGPERQLRCLFELAWRYDTCLMPLFSDFADQIVATTSCIAPFPQLGSPVAAALTPLSVKGTGFDWRTTSEQWLFLNKILLRHYRETLETEKFEGLCLRLSPLAKTDADLAAFIAYQQCIRALERLDHEAARSTLTAWSEISSADPQWRLRKAALYAELGAIDDAEREADLALKEIREANLRSTAAPGSDDIANLSKEGWALALLRGVTMMRRMLSNQSHPDFRGRWEQLASLRCSPWPIIEDLQASMSGDAPLPPRRNKKSGTFRLSSNDGTFERLQPALQAARLVEDAPYPVSGPGVKIADSLLQRAAEWLSAEMPARALAIFIRLGEDKALQEFLSLARIAVLTPKETSEFLALANAALVQGGKQLSLMEGHAGREPRDDAYQQVRTALRLMIELALRLDQDSLNMTIHTALGLCKSPLYYSDYDIHRKLRALLGQSFSALLPDSLTRLVLPVIAQPLLGVDYNSHFANWRDDTSWNLFRQFTAPNRDHHANEWRDAIDRLIRNLAQGPAIAQLQAMLRCCLLNRMGLLTTEEALRVADATWESADLPSLREEFNALPSWLILLVPEPTPGVARRFLGRRAFGEPLASFRSPMEMPDGTKRSGWRMGGADSGDALRSILLLSPKPLRSRAFLA
jgi:hypothetical protein